VREKIKIDNMQFDFMGGKGNICHFHSKTVAGKLKVQSEE